MGKLFLKLIQKYFLTIDSDIRAGDIVKLRNNDAKYEAVGFRWDYNLKATLFIRDPEDQRIYEVKISDYQRVTDPGVIANASY